ncbi:glycosyltransferase family 2 protein [Caloramator proteoclasticus]|uniref:Glucosyl-3-phosphoglycerate synthase n=1 Tax=Caloramator proteoclasticus DSM 10124 TaxID=1121262 RepID=A0A1M4SLK3_9CLOT|nr:glycosyltransferase family 2 protein [Caloramator proteoclasticus]SHE33154.1 Glycosyl transferase family 2 [Caloramator proteoclasticus DSM 10124]
MFIDCIIPAYNEEKTVGDVIDVVKKVDCIRDIIVVNDGSNDNTSLIAKSKGVKVVDNKKNMGKGAAIKIGLENSDADVILLLDADLIGLTPNHILDLLNPVLSNEADMSVGIFSSGRLATDLAQFVAPNLSGQRALKRFVLDTMDNMDITKYGVEVALTKHVQRMQFKVKNVEMKDMTHIMKEEKLGFVRGFKARLKMYYDILKCLRT